MQTATIRKLKAAILHHLNRRPRLQDRGNPSQPGGPSTEEPVDYRSEHDVSLFCSVLGFCGLGLQKLKKWVEQVEANHKGGLDKAEGPGGQTWGLDMSLSSKALHIDVFDGWNMKVIIH